MQRPVRDSPAETNEPCVYVHCEHWRTGCFTYPTTDKAGETVASGLAALPRPGASPEKIDFAPRRLYNAGVVRPSNDMGCEMLVRNFFSGQVSRHLSWACLLASATLFTSEVGANELPRYRFRPGQELTYQLITPRNEWQDAKLGKIIEYELTLTWNICVTRENADGTWRLVFACRWSSAAPKASVIYSNGYFDLSEDGRATGTDTVMPGIGDVTILFPPLATADEFVASKWRATSPIDGAVHNVNMLEAGEGANAEDSRFAEEITSLFNALYERSEHREYLFDRKQGLVRSGAIAVKQSSGQRPFDSVMKIEFLGVRQLPSEELAQLDSESSQFVAADQEYRSLLNRATYHDCGNAKDLLDKAKVALTTIQPQLKMPVMKAMIETKIKMHEDSQSSILSDAATFASISGKPAPDWKTTDFDGNPHALGDYRGKVVVLDFWFRGCTWCLRCMPQIKQLADDFREQDVAILGMNNDEAQDARFVIEKAQLNYPTLKDEHQAIRKSFRTPATYPTMIVLDAKGDVRHVHNGYSPDLRREISEAVRNLLAESKSHLPDSDR